MKVFILAGGKATRFNNGRPGPIKTFLKVNNKTILENIINIYLSKGFKEFYILSGYNHMGLKKGLSKLRLNKNIKIKIIFSGVNTQTGGRIAFIKKFLEKDELFFLTYADSLANFDAIKALSLKKKNNYIISVYRYLLPYGVVKLKQKNIVNFYEKKNYNYINAGFYIFDSSILKYIKNKNDKLEVEVFKRIIKSKNKYLVPNTLNSWYPIDDWGNLIIANQKFKKSL